MSFVAKIFDRNANKKAAKQQAAAEEAARAQVAQTRTEDIARQEPYRAFGNQAIGSLNSLLGYSPTGDGTTTNDAGAGVLAALRARPGYQARLQEGTDQVQQSAAANGLLASGSTLKALDQYSQDYASNEYDKEIARQMGVLGVGQGATQGQVATSQAGSNTIAELLAKIGQTKANGTRASSWGPAFQAFSDDAAKAAMAFSGSPTSAKGF
jgi:hypothetical protein